MISIVIPAYNEELLIKSCLDAFVNQITTKKFEVILVNNNSTDNTAIIANIYNNWLNLTVIFEKTKGRGAARKKGFETATGNIILSTDADTLVPSDWVEKLSNYLEISNGEAVTGTCKIVDCSWSTNVIINFLQPFLMRIYRLFIGHYWLSGFNFAIYKTAYLKSGGFSSGLNAQEDIDLSFKVNKIGKINFVPNLPVIFSGRRFKNGLIIGLVPYIATFLNIFLFKRNNIILPDVR